MIAVLGTRAQLLALVASVVEATAREPVQPRQVSVYNDDRAVAIETWRGKPMHLYVSRLRRVDSSDDRELWGFQEPEFPVGRGDAVQPGCEIFRHRWSSAFFPALEASGLDAWRYGITDKTTLPAEYEH